jgi:hypothetical protein
MIINIEKKSAVTGMDVEQSVPLYSNTTSAGEYVGARYFVSDPFAISSLGCELRVKPFYTWSIWFSIKEQSWKKKIGACGLISIQGIKP